MWIKSDGTLYNSDHFVQVWEETRPLPAKSKWNATLTHVELDNGKTVALFPCTMQNIIDAIKNGVDYLEVNTNV